MEKISINNPTASLYLCHFCGSFICVHLQDLTSHIKRHHPNQSTQLLDMVRQHKVYKGYIDIHPHNAFIKPKCSVTITVLMPKYYFDNGATEAFKLKHLCDARIKIYKLIKLVYLKRGGVLKDDINNLCPMTVLLCCVAEMYGFNYVYVTPSMIDTKDKYPAAMPIQYMDNGQRLIDVYSLYYIIEPDCDYMIFIESVQNVLTFMDNKHISMYIYCLSNIGATRFLHDTC